MYYNVGSFQKRITLVEIEVLNGVNSTLLIVLLFNAHACMFPSQI